MMDVRCPMLDDRCKILREDGRPKTEEFRIDARCSGMTEAEATPPLFSNSILEYKSLKKGFGGF